MAGEIGGGLRARRAAGEFSVIVLGVLVALFLESAWGDWQDRRLAGEYVERLQTEVAFNKREIAKDQHWIGQVCGLGGELRAELFASSDVTDSVLLLKAFMVALNRSPSTRSSTYQDLVSTGRLALLKDPGLRDRILGYYDGARVTNFEFWRPNLRGGEYRGHVLRTLPPEWTSARVVCIRDENDEPRADWDVCAEEPAEGAAHWLAELRSIPGLPAALSDRTYEVCSYEAQLETAQEALDSLGLALTRSLGG